MLRIKPRGSLRKVRQFVFLYGKDRRVHSCPSLRLGIGFDKKSTVLFSRRANYEQVHVIYISDYYNSLCYACLEEVYVVEEV